MEDDRQIDPRCAEGRNIFISSDGWLLPCCHAHMHLRRQLAAPGKARPHDRWFLDNADMFDLSQRSIGEIMADPRWGDLQRLWTEGQPPSVCRHHCGVAKGSAPGTATKNHGADRTVRKL